MAEKNHWKNGSPEKAALHAAVGAVIADITSGNIASGAIAGGSTEYLTKAILKASKGDKAQAQWIAMIVGAALGKASGGNEQLGAEVAVNAVRNNLFLEYISEFTNSIDSLDFNQLEEGEMWVYGYNTPLYTETMIICNNESRDIYSSISFGKGIGVLPVSLQVGKAHFEDSNGNKITDFDVIKGNIEGLSTTTSAALLLGVSTSEGKYGFKLVSKNVTTNFAFGISTDYTYHVGTFEEGRLKRAKDD